MNNKALNDIIDFIKFCSDNEKHLNKNQIEIDNEKERLSNLTDMTDQTSGNLLAHKDCNLLENSANNVSSYEIYSMKSLQSSIFEEYKNDICKNYIDCNDYENNDEPSIGGKINLKRYKKKIYRE